MTHKRR